LDNLSIEEEGHPQQLSQASMIYYGLYTVDQSPIGSNKKKNIMEPSIDLSSRKFSQAANILTIEDSTLLNT